MLAIFCFRNERYPGTSLLLLLVFTFLYFSNLPPQTYQKMALQGIWKTDKVRTDKMRILQPQEAPVFSKQYLLFATVAPLFY